MLQRCLPLLLLLFIITNTYSQKLTIGTYNLRYANAGDSAKGNGWGQRLPAIVSLIRFHDWDIFGTQEVKSNQVKDLSDSLAGYAYIGVGRDDGKQAGEYSAIWYRKDKFQLLQGHTFWLSTDTTKPNVGWDAALPRICTWGQFREVKTGLVFYFFNLHMDHIGVVARRESAKLVLEKIKAMTGNTPTILTGDFNVDQTNESYTLINTSGLLRDAYELSPVKFATNGTFNDFNINNRTNSRIDHIFLTKDFTAQRYAILTNIYWSQNASTDTSASSNPSKEVATSFMARTPSDHYPVMVEVEYKMGMNRKK